MQSSDPISTTAPHAWLVADTSRSVMEVLGIVGAVIGVALWVGGLVWFIVRDVSHAVEHSHHRHDHGNDADGLDHSGQSSPSGRADR